MDAEIRRNSTVEGMQLNWSNIQIMKVMNPRVCFWTEISVDHVEARKNLQLGHALTAVSWKLDCLDITTVGLF